MLEYGLKMVEDMMKVPQGFPLPNPTSGVITIWGIVALKNQIMKP